MERMTDFYEVKNRNELRSVPTWWETTARTSDLLRVKQALSQLELSPRT